MSDDDTQIPDGGRTLAAEYVLGVLSATERRAVELRLPSDQALASEVAFWESRLGPLTEIVAPVLPPSSVWQGIETVIAPPSAAPARAGLWQSLFFWRTFAVSSAGLAVASLTALLVIAQPPLARAPLIASLDATGGVPGFVAAVRPDGNSVMIVPASLASTDARAMELWIIPPGGRPHSLGLIQPGRPVQLNVPRELIPHMRSDAVLAISLEPPGGSPTGLPTGPVIANGKLTNL